MSQSHSKAQQPARAEEAEYFNLHASGCGYLSRVRWVDPGKRRGGRTGDQFLACAINALRGDVASPSYTYFDLKVSGEEAIELIDQLKPTVEENRKVFLAFKLGDFYAHPYERDAHDNRGQKTGKKEISALIKGRLLLITHVKVDGEVVYQREDDAGPGEPSLDRDAANAPSAEAADERADEASDPVTSGIAVSEERSAPRPRSLRRNGAATADRTRVRGYGETADA
jgi:hypothetical protein